MSKCFVIHVQLEDITPTIWRRFEIRENKTFWDLHCAIQDVMPWNDTHLHEFEVSSGDQKAQIGIDGDDLDDYEALPGWDTRLKDWFLAAPTRCIYLYDFGDSWRHTLTLEAIRPAERGGTYPRCLGGERRCPPEDVGGAHGYQEFLEALADPDHEEHQSYREWIDGSWDANAFSAEKVRFSKPLQRLRRAGLG